MTHLYSSCRSACLSATWRFRDALLHSTLPQSWQVNSFFADWVFREFKFSPVIEVSTETQQRTAHAAAHPQHTLKPRETSINPRETRISPARPETYYPFPSPLAPFPAIVFLVASPSRRRVDPRSRPDSTVDSTFISITRPSRVASRD